MIVLESPREWHETAMAAAYSWPAAKRDELVTWMWTRSEPAIRILASVLEASDVRLVDGEAR